MAQSVNVLISVEGEEIKVFSQITINETIHTHHSFELIVPADIFHTTSYKLLEKSKSYLGKKINFQFSTKIFESKYKNKEFKGLITDVGFVSIKGNKNIRICGSSPTILMDGKGQLKSFTDKSLSIIAESALEKIPMNLKVINKPSYLNSIPYMVQYHESNFKFLQRISAKYGEWFYYDGTNIVFGKFNESPAIELPFGANLYSLEYSLKLIHTNEKTISYNYADDLTHELQSSSIDINGTDDLTKFALDKSKVVFNQEPLNISREQVVDKKQLSNVMKAGKSATSRGMVTAKGASDLPYISAGSLVDITGDAVREDDFGKLIISSVTHTIDNTCSYENTFTAIPAKSKNPPAVNFSMPIAQAQPAVVKENSDPEGMGRVKVKFFWHGGNETTPWIRVAGVMAGKFKSKVHGFYFVPEIGDQVVVDFEDSNPDKPFVVSGVFHKNAVPSSWKKGSNDFKVICTKSGNEISFSDVNNKEEIRISNTNSENPTNLISLSMEKGGGITIKTKGELILDAKSISLIAKEGVEIKSGSLSVDSKKDATVKAAVIKLN